MISCDSFLRDLEWGIVQWWRTISESTAHSIDQQLQPSFIPINRQLFHCNNKRVTVFSLLLSKIKPVTWNSSISTPGDISTDGVHFCRKFYQNVPFALFYFWNEGSSSIFCSIYLKLPLIVFGLTLLLHFSSDECSTEFFMFEKIELQENEKWNYELTLKKQPIILFFGK